jgi:hypothetical protein
LRAAHRNSARDLEPYPLPHNILEFKMTEGEFLAVGTKLLEEPCSVICLLSALASLRKDIMDERGGSAALSDEREEALNDVRSAFTEIVTTFNILYIPVNDRRLLNLWYTGMDYFQRSSCRFYRNYSVIKAFQNGLRDEPAQASIARLTSTDMHDQLQTTIKQLISPIVSAFLSQLSAFYETMSPEWLCAVIWKQSNILSSILNLYVQEKVTSLIVGRPGPGCFHIWYARVRSAFQQNLLVLLAKLKFYEGRPYDCNTVLSQTAMSRFCFNISACFPHQLPLLDEEDMSLEDPDFWPSDDDEKLDQATRDDVYAFMLLVNRKTVELSDSATSQRI